MKTFEYQMYGDPAEKFSQVQQLAAAKGVTLIGDSTRAVFSGIVSGSYSRSGTTITVTITNKPLLASWTMIDSMLREFIES
jgi:hypothetical protein